MSEYPFKDFDFGKMYIAPIACGEDLQTITLTESEIQKSGEKKNIIPSINHEVITKKLIEAFRSFREYRVTISSSFPLKLGDDKEEAIADRIKTDTLVEHVFMANSQVDDFINKHELGESILWLKAHLPYYFNGCFYEIELIHTVEDDYILTVNVIGNISNKDFCEGMFFLCEEMLTAGHKKLYQLISIIQQLPESDGLQRLFRYCGISLR